MPLTRKQSQPTKNKRRGQKGKRPPPFYAVKTPNGHPTPHGRGETTRGPHPPKPPRRPPDARSHTRERDRQRDTSSENKGGRTQTPRIPRPPAARNNSNDTPTGPRGARASGHTTAKRHSATPATNPIGGDTQNFRAQCGAPTHAKSRRLHADITKTIDL